MSWLDLAALTAIFFGPAMVTSLSSAMRAPAAVDPSAYEFSTAANWGALLQQGLLLAVGVAYLVGRRIKLARWSLRPSLKGTVFGLGLFAFVGLVFDLAYGLYGYVAGVAEAGEAAENPESTRDVSLLAYAVFNSFYEEFFFLVICLSLSRKYRAHALAFSLLVRFSFHTYQGLLNAALIGFVTGSVFAYARLLQKGHSLYPFVLAHALADVLGAGLISLVRPR